MDDIEDFGDISEFETPMHFQNVLRDIDNGLIPKLNIALMIASVGYDSLSDFFEEVEIEDPEVRREYTAFHEMYDIEYADTIHKVPAKLPYFIGFDFDGQQLVLFLEEENLINYISFEW